MGYPQELMAGALVKQSNAFDTAEVLTAAAAVYGSYVAHYPLMVQRLTFQISSAVSDLTGSVVAMQKVSVADVTTAIASITVPNGSAVRKVLWKDFSPVKIGVGDKLEFKQSVQGGLGGTPAGAGFYGFVAQLQPEYVSNETNYIAG